MLTRSKLIDKRPTQTPQTGRVTREVDGEPHGTITIEVKIACSAIGKQINYSLIVSSSSDGLWKVQVTIRSD